MSIIQELESILGVTFPEPFNYIVASICLFFFLGMIYNFIKVVFRLFNSN